MEIKTETRVTEKEVLTTVKTEEKRYILDLSEAEAVALRGIYGRTTGANMPESLKFLSKLYNDYSLCNAYEKNKGPGFVSVVFK